MGISSEKVILTPTELVGTYTICSTAILGKFAKQLDTQLDDGETSTGSVRVALASAPSVSLTTSAINDSNSYNVCLAF